MNFKTGTLLLTSRAISCVIILEEVNPKNANLESYKSHLGPNSYEYNHFYKVFREGEVFWISSLALSGVNTFSKTDLYRFLTFKYEDVAYPDIFLLSNPYPKSNFRDYPHNITQPSIRAKHLILP